jgi:hypothetical protein
MATISRSRNDLDGHVLAFFDKTTDETTVRLQPAVLDEDFVGAGHSSIPAFGSPATGYPWVQKTVKTSGSPSVAIIANSAAGIVACALDATSEAQEATLYANDQLNWDVTKNLFFEARAAMSVLPSVAGVEAVFGLQSAWAAGPDNASYYLRFQMNGSGLVNLQSKDGVTTKSVSSGVTLLAGAFHLFRIDASNLSNIRFFIDGTEVSSSGAFTFAAVPPQSVLQPYSSVYKASGTGVGTLQLDMIQAATNRI